MKRLFTIILTLLLFIVLPPDTQAASTLEEIKEIVKSEYVGDIKGNIDNARTIDEAIKMLDPYSAYFTAEQYEDFLNSLELKQVGIGVIIQKHEKGILITDVLKDGSAYENGLEAGDIITKVDSIPLKDKSLEEGQLMILGE
ncbi:MAG: PDZ domain-containing protein [Lysinibacillus sp.]|nr:PDZ domain-containing protein [Lysinibacillus sp.]